MGKDELDSTILVTGGTGFIGSHLVEALVDRGYPVRCLVRETSDLKYCKDLGVEFAYGDMTEKTSLQNAVKGADTVFHLAGIIGKWGTPEEAYMNSHVVGTQNLLDCCIENNVKRFIYCSSGGVLGPLSKTPATEKYPYNPSNPYERAKAEAEKCVLNCSDRLQVTVIRPEFVYGPGDKHVLQLFNSIQNGKFKVLGNGKSLLHPTYINDLTRGFLLCLEKNPTSGEVYHIVGERAIEVENYSSMISQELGVPSSKTHVPVKIATSAAWACESIAKLTGYKPPITRSQVKFFTENRVFDASKAKRELNYTPIELKQGIRETVSWYRQNGYLPKSSSTSAFSINTAYEFALAEGEGLGTAYEYIMKKELLNRLVADVGQPRSILIAGLPEKYGFSIDFVKFAENANAKITVIDDRESRLSQFNQVLNRLKKHGYFTDLQLTELQVSDWAKITLDKTFNLVISCEVLQRLSASERIAYINNMNAIADNAAFFSPNGDNSAHAKVSKLHTLKLVELKSLCCSGGYHAVDYGYVDMPPFPPGLKQKKAQGVTKPSGKMKLLSKGLNVWAKLENKFPQGLTSKQAHIVYFMGRRI